MIRTIIEYPSGNRAYKLEPDEGYRYITDGETWSEWALIGENNPSIDNWHDTNEDPPTPPDPVDPETQELADLVEENYESCLEIIGGE